MGLIELLQLSGLSLLIDRVFIELHLCFYWLVSWFSN